MTTIKEHRENISFMLIGVLLLLLFNSVAADDQGVVYKDTRPLKSIFDVKPESETDDMEATEREYLYDPRDKTDPFKSFITVRTEKEAKEKKEPMTYLETLDLSQLSLSVIVISSKDKWAMVRDPKGLGHVIKEGTAIGTNGGIVHKIQAGEIIVREEYQDFRGKAQFRDIAKKPPSLQ